MELRELAEMLYTTKEEQDAFVTKVEAKGLKLADLSNGEYVSKAKFDDRMTKFTNLKTQFGELKNSSNVSEDVKKEIETLKTQLEEANKTRDEFKNKVTQAEYLSSIDESKIDKPFRNFVLNEVSKNVSDTMNFKDCLTKYVADNPQYLAKEVERPSGLTFSSAGTGQAGVSNANQELNDFIRRF